MSLSKGLKWLIAICLGIPLLLIGISAWVSFDALAATRASAQWVVHAYDVRGRLREVWSDIQDAETGQRGFLLTQQKAFLEPYTTAATRIPLRFDLIRELVANKPIQREHLAQLQTLVKDKLDFTRQSISLEENGRHEEALALVNSGYGRNKMDDIRRVVADMNQEEARLLDEREAAFSRQLSRNKVITAGIMALQVLLTVGVGILLWRIARLRSFVTVCAWSRTIQYEGKWITFEEYMHRRFGFRITHGINPDEAERLMDQINAGSTSTGSTKG
jgi:CHASE3 domain sensor protein